MARIRYSRILVPLRIRIEQARSIQHPLTSLHGWRAENRVLHPGHNHHRIGILRRRLDDEAKPRHFAGRDSVLGRVVDRCYTGVVAAGEEGCRALRCSGGDDVAEGCAGVALGEEGGGRCEGEVGDGGEGEGGGEAGKDEGVDVRGVDAGVGAA